MTREQANKLMDLIRDLREADSDLNDVAYQAETFMKIRLMLARMLW